MSNTFYSELAGYEVIEGLGFRLRLFKKCWRSIVTSDEDADVVMNP